jgi:hypothetical protein
VKQIQDQKTQRARKRGFSNQMTLEDIQNYVDENSEIPGRQIVPRVVRAKAPFQRTRIRPSSSASTSE